MCVCTYVCVSVYIYLNMQFNRQNWFVLPINQGRKYRGGTEKLCPQLQLLNYCSYHDRQRLKKTLKQASTH